MYHLHYTSHSRDCDGPHEYYSDYRPDRDDIDWTDELDIAMDFVMPMMFTYPEDGNVQMEIGRDSQDRLFFVSSKSTDEGYKSEVYVVCDEDDWDGEEAHSQRDVFAERMGY